MKEKRVIEWEALEFQNEKKTPDWFWVLWILSISIIIVSVIFGNMSFAILVFISAFALSLQAVQHPKMVNFKMDEKGIIIYNKKYLFQNMDSYWIKEDDEEDSRIIMKSKKAIIPYLIIPIGDTDAEEINDFLEGCLEKKEIEEPPHHKITKYL